MSIRIAINGAAGRMGRLLVTAILDSDDLELVAALEHPEHPWIGRDVASLLQREPCGIPLKAIEPGVAENADVVIDFSLPGGTSRVLDCFRETALVVGTTGLDPDTARLLETHSRRAPVVASPNFATGVAVLAEMLAYAAAALPSFDVEIVEAHHGRKRDAPSGTALRLARSAAAARNLDLDDVVIHGREGEVGPRPEGQIGIHAVRGGDIIGEHEVYLAGPGERLRVAHLATSREAFVQGALRAARWVHGKRAGRYSVLDVLGMRPCVPRSNGGM